MHFVDFVSWWYGTGWLERVGGLKQRLAYWWNYFSIPALALSLFSPWRQIRPDNAPDRSFDQMMRDALDSLVSRFVGSWVRGFVIIAGFISLSLIFVFNILFILFWPLLPVVPFMLIVFGAAQ